MGFNVGGNFNSKDFKYVEGNETITNNTSQHQVQDRDTSDQLKKTLDDLKETLTLIIEEKDKSDEYKMNKIINEFEKNDEPDIIEALVKLGISGIKRFIY